MSPQEIWQGQKSEYPAMTVQEIREKVKSLRAKARSTRIFNLVTALVITAIFIRVFVLYVHGWYGRISWSLVLAGTFYMLGYLVYESLPLKRAEHAEMDAGISSCLRFYRRMLEQKRQHARHMAFAALPLVAGGMMSFLPAFALTIQHPDGNLWVRLFPFSIILAAWFVLFLIMRRRIRREFHSEFAMLKALEREFPEE
jgi:hypothetical protein